MLDFSQLIILEDEAVMLRSLEPSDLNHLLPFSLYEPEIWSFSLLSGAGKENLEKYIQQAITARKEKKEMPFVVIDKRTNGYAGSTRFYDIQETNKTLQLGFTWYGKKFQGTGLNKHCKFLLLDYAFNTLQMERVEFRADNRNLKSIAAMKSIGCTVEGILRSHGFTPQGTRRDSIILSILKSEWDQDLRTQLKKKVDSMK